MCGTNGLNRKGTANKTHPVQGMIDSNAYHSSLATWPAQVEYIHIYASGKFDVSTYKTPKGTIIVDGRDIRHSLTEGLANFLVDLNTRMYNKYNNRSWRTLMNINEKYIPSLIIVSTMDMDLAHLSGYDGVFIKPSPLDRGDNLRYQRWSSQIDDVEGAVVHNPLRLYPLFSYDPRRYRLPCSGKVDNNWKTWREPFARIVGCNDPIKDDKKFWLGFCMNPSLGFRPFDECCEHLPEFYKLCQTYDIPILAHCAPGGITTHEARSGEYEIFNKRILKTRLAKKKERNKKYCTSNYYGQERVVDDNDLNYFYMNYGHPRNWIPVLEHCPNLRLCFAGFGGNSEWYHSSMNGWAKTIGVTGNQLPPRDWISCIIKLTKYENVYADISGLNISVRGIYDGLRRMLHLIESNHKDFKHLKYKLIFGSSWYLTSMRGVPSREDSDHDSYGSYCNNFKTLFYDVGKEFNNNGVLWERVSLINPWNFYGLSADKINKMHSVLKTSRGVFSDMLTPIKELLVGGPDKIKVELAKYIADYNKEHPDVDAKNRATEIDNNLIASEKLSDTSDKDDLKIFSQKEFDSFKQFIDENAAKPKGVRLNCIKTAYYGLQKLLSTSEIPYNDTTMHTMGNLMKVAKSLGYAGDGISFGFKGPNGEIKNVIKPTNYFENKSLSRIVKDHIGKKSGYYVFGMSIMDGYHSTILIANVRYNTVTFNIFDQNGSLIYNNGAELIVNISNSDATSNVVDQSSYLINDFGTDCWYNADDLDKTLLSYVSNGAVLHRKNKPDVYSVTTTTIYPLNKKWGLL